ncbi:MAG: hypothetical protein HY675_08845 [Chloroflexi bacterium]|nr:hypothetical protein [Chloroflexota bacterium]
MARQFPVEWRYAPPPGKTAITQLPAYTVFVHVVRQDGTLVAQHDGPPAGGYAPTSGWTPGQAIYDYHPIALPPNVPAGVHLVRVGLYELASGKRVPVVDASGQEIGDSVTLDTGAVRR